MMEERPVGILMICKVRKICYVLIFSYEYETSSEEIFIERDFVSVELMSQLRIVYCKLKRDTSLIRRSVTPTLSIIIYVNHA